MSSVSGYRAVIFDWDGTLLDSTHHIVQALLLACEDLNLPAPSAQEAGWVIGLSIQAALYRLVPDLPAQKYADFSERYREHFLRLQHEMHLFAGQRELLADLHGAGAVLGVATGKSRRGLDHSMDSLDLRQFFQATRTVDEARGKPDPDMLHQLLAQLDLRPQEVIMVGDTTHDVSMAQAAGVDCLAVAYGAHPLEQLQASAPTALCSSVAQMQAWLRARLL